ncbi:MAG: hypothetical protein IJV69_03760 [Kiritimatiellae bacterium]|nr:hypothetical protein [Kiritimatiellia bacterium]
MKKMMLLAFAALFGASIVCAALTAGDLAPKAVRTKVAALPAKQRQDYARQIIEAVAATPQDEAAKTQALTTTARALIAGARSGGALGIIAEVYNTTPVTNLQGVSDLLSTNNFGQKLNGMTDAQFDAFATRLVTTGAQYIQASGTDSPTLRISIMVAAFTKASSDPERTRQQLIAALPPAMQAAATTYIAASETSNTDVIAAAAGVDAVEPTPADPDADKVVKPAATPVAETPAVAEDKPAMEARTDYLTPEPADKGITSEGAKVTATDPAAEGDAAKVPLIARVVSDVQGQTWDAMQMSVYEWDAIDPEERIDDPQVPTLPGLGSVFAVPGEANPAAPEELPSWEEMETPSLPYGNQGIAC